MATNYDVQHQEQQHPQKQQQLQLPQLQDEQPIPFLNALYKKYYEKGGNGVIEVRLVLKGAGSASHFYDRPGDLMDDLLSIRSLNQDGFDIYYSVNPRPRTKEKEEKDVRDIICIWMDVDGKNFEGDKGEALSIIQNFSLKPNIITDSGHGYQLCWILEEPILQRTEAQSEQLKRILSGIAKALNADTSCFDFSRLLRLPGTINAKFPDKPVPCELRDIFEGRYYSLEDFAAYEDDEYLDPDETYSLPDYEGTSVPIDQNDREQALQQIKELKISTAIKRMIITGERDRSAKDKTRSGRDMSIINSLVAANYCRPTIHGICRNPLLGCSNRLLTKDNGGEHQLDFEINKARLYQKKSLQQDTEQLAAIERIKSDPDLKGEERLKAICRFIIKDLFGENGEARKDVEQNIYYYFDKRDKSFLDIESAEFQCLIKSRYGLPVKHNAEILSWIRTHIWGNGRAVTSFDFADFDKQAGVLYIANQKNQNIRQDGHSITLVDNGTDGIFFKSNPGYSPIDFTPGGDSPVRYFRDGFDWEAFKTGSLYRDVIAKANFAVEETCNLSPDDQQYLLSIYFFSLFFESLQQEKPIVCVTGAKASGKSFLITAIGKLLFGSSFQPTHLQDSVKDFKVSLADNYFLCLDNVDDGIKPEYLDAFCIAATGGVITCRKLYTNNEEMHLRPRVFLSMTSRDLEFRRDDFVDRLIILNTAKINAPISRTALFDEIIERRGAILNEVLVNLNDVVRLLNERANWKPAGIFRIADFELFGKKLHSPTTVANFIRLLQKMNRKKSDFSLEDDEAYILLRSICYDDNSPISDVVGTDLYQKLSVKADHLGLTSYKTRYKGPRHLCRRLVNIREELEDEFNVNVRRGRARFSLYSFSKRDER